MNVFSISIYKVKITSRLGKYILRLLRLSAGVIILEKQSKSYHISPTQFKIGLKMSQKKLMEINLQMLASLNWEEQ